MCVCVCVCVCMRILYIYICVVSRFGDVPWPPRSPDLSARDFFLWGYLKSKVYVRKPRTVDDLKVSIREEIATVPKEMLVNVM